MTPYSSSSAPRRLLGRILAGALAATIVFVPALSAHAGADEAIVAAVADPSEGPQAGLVPAHTGDLRPGADLSATLSLLNTTSSPLPRGTAALKLSETPLTTRDDIRGWLAEPHEIADARTIATTEIERLDVGDRTNARFTASAKAPASESEDETAARGSNPPRTAAARVDALPRLVPGVYPVYAEYAGALSASVIVVSEPDAAAAPFAVILPITAPHAASGLLSAEELEELTSPGGTLATLLDAANGTPAILAVDPAIPAAIRVLGAAAPETAKDWLARLEELENDRFALPFADADVAAQLESGASQPLAPLSLDAFLPSEGFTEEPSEETTSAPSPPSDEETTPTLDQLLAIDASGTPAREIALPASGTIDREVLQRYAERKDATSFLVSSRSLAAPGEGSRSGLVRDGKATVLAYDAGLSAALDVAATSTGTERDAALVTAYALSRIRPSEAPSLAVLSRQENPSWMSLRSSLTLLPQTGPGRPASLNDVFTSDAKKAALSEHKPAPETQEAITRILDADHAASQIGSVLVSPELLRGDFRARALQLLSVDALENGSPETGTFVEETAGLRERVTMVKPSSVQVIAPEVKIPVTVKNDLDYDIRVVVVARPDDVRLDVKTFTDQVVPARQSARVQIAVLARLGNGEVDITLQLRSAADPGVVFGDTQTINVTVRAEWERTGLIILGVLVVGFFSIGLVRTLRRRRADRRAPGEAASVDAASATEDRA